MAAKSKQAMLNGSHQGDNALQRFLRLPMVNSACISLQKTYNATKELHPLVASVCEAYERGVQAASSLARWSVEPVVQKLEPQLAAANVLACQGLDHLEQRIPALHKPVEEVTSELKDSIHTHVQSTVHSIADALDRILGLAAERYKQTQSTVREAAKGTRSSQVSHLAETGVDTATGKVKKLVDLLLSKPKSNSVRVDSGVHASREGFPSSIFRKIRTLAHTVFQHAYRETTRAAQHTRDKGQEWAMWIPGLGGLAQQVFSKIQESTSEGQRKASEKEEERKNKDDTTNMKSFLRPASGDEGQASMVNQTWNVQTANFATISAEEGDHVTPCDAAGQRSHLSPRRAVPELSTKVAVLWEILQAATSSLLGVLSHYVPVARLLVKEDRTATVATDGAETAQLQKSDQPATHAQERTHYQPQGDWRSNRGHFPLSFLNLDEPTPAQQAPFQHRAPAFEADHPGTRKSAFSPYKEAAGSRRLSEGLCRPSLESAYGKVHYTGLHGTALKKD
ncbi:perilipin-1 [Sphaerodactylus townsendi]|uniref:Uncharacterized protein n=1 Tax=Sphaerodactylus townsendi TaxID=933632 RepID=A0ACB8E5Y9_9SAUR|nr:perilipin-1 [Sphaerodactylus townsendi]